MHADRKFDIGGSNSNCTCLSPIHFFDFNSNDFFWQRRILVGTGVFGCQ